MMPLLFVAALLASETPIIVTAARQPVAEAEAPVSATTFEEEIEALAPLLAVDLLRLAPGVAVAQSGPRGSQAQVRIRGAEANHTLLFIDGIRFNDPAAGNEARFELLAADPLARLELVHGPQSALWGSEALGGVIAAETADPLQAEGIAAAGEYGELDSVRLFGRGAFRAGPLGIAAAAGWQVSDGVDALGAGGDLDGFRLFNANLKARARLGAIELGLTGLWLDGRTDFDGFDPVTFLRADTLDRSDNRIGAAGISADGNWGAWSARGRLSYLDSINRNSLGGAYQNHTTGSRVSALAQLSRTLGRHTLIAAAEHDRESFRARDVAFGGFSNQDRSRMASALVAEWRAAWSDPIHTDLAVRHDMFSAFADATTLRAAVLVRPGGGWSLHVGYGEGIAQPTFFDLFGFFPGTFVGNPFLVPEHSRGFEAGLGWRGEGLRFAATAFSHRLRDEVIETFDPATFTASATNASGTSRRAGLELEADVRLSEAFNLSVSYTFLDADEQRIQGSALVREVRRPRHGANLFLSGESGRFSWGAGMSYVGDRRDLDFDRFPAAMVILDDYWLGSARLSWEILPGVEIYGRVENVLDARYQDVVGYHPAGRTFHAGLRLVPGR